MQESLLWRRLGAASGAVGVGLNVVAALLGDPYRSGFSPDPTDPSPSIARALTSMRDDARTRVMVGLIGAFLLIWFFAYLRSHLARHEGADDWMSAAAHGGGLVTVALLLVSHSITLGATELTDYGADPVIAKVFLTYGWNYFYVVSPALMALVASAAVIGLRFGALPRWLAIVGLFSLLIPFVAGAGMGAMVGLLWVLLASLVLSFAQFRKQPPVKERLARAG